MDSDIGNFEPCGSPEGHGFVRRLPVFALLAAGQVMAGAADEDRVLEAMHSANVPGLAIAVVRDDTIEIATYGSAVPDEAVAVTEETVFEAASLSKTVFAAMLVERVMAGDMSLDESLLDTPHSGRVADRAAYEQLTPRLLLSHQSGLPNWAGDAMDPDRLDPLEFQRPPGSGFGYSGEGYELLRWHVESRFGRSLEALFGAVRNRYGMPSSRYAYDRSPRGSAVARGPDPDKNRGIPPVSRGNAAASLVTTVGDYARFIRYLLGHPDLLRRLLVPEVTVEDENTDRVSWGLGWGIYAREDGSRIAFHWGDNYQFKAFVAIDPATATGVVYFANGVNGLKLVPHIVEPVVGELAGVRAWLDYEDQVGEDQVYEDQGDSSQVSSHTPTAAYGPARKR